MELLALALTALVAAVVITAYRLVTRPPPQAEDGGWLEEVVRRRVLVHTRDGQTIDGQLVRVDRDGVVLSPATLADGAIDLAGRVFVPREQVAWLQQPPASSEG